MHAGDAQQSSAACVVTGARNVHLLYNYLLGCRLCHTTTGPQAGLPPTILAPQHFVLATMRQADINVRCVDRANKPVQVRSR